MFIAVTLLALGNGAPDLVSSIAFVRAGQYRVAISGLLGKYFSPALSACQARACGTLDLRRMFAKNVCN